MECVMFMLERYYILQMYNVVLKLNAKLHNVQPFCHRNNGTQKRTNLWRDIAYCQLMFLGENYIAQMNILEMV